MPEAATAKFRRFHWAEADRAGDGNYVQRAAYRYVDKRNRPSQAVFRCRSCGVVAHADHNAAQNIASRAQHVWAAVSQPHAALPSRPVARTDCKPAPSGAGR